MKSPTYLTPPLGFRYASAAADICPRRPGPTNSKHDDKRLNEALCYGLIHERTVQIPRHAKCRTPGSHPAVYALDVDRRAGCRHTGLRRWRRMNPALWPRLAVKRGTDRSGKKPRSNSASPCILMSDACCHRCNPRVQMSILVSIRHFRHHGPLRRLPGGFKVLDAMANPSPMSIPARIPTTPICGRC